MFDTVIDACSMERDFVVVSLMVTDSDKLTDIDGD